MGKGIEEKQQAKTRKIVKLNLTRNDRRDSRKKKRKTHKESEPSDLGNRESGERPDSPIKNEAKIPNEKK